VPWADTGNISKGLPSQTFKQYLSGVDFIVRSSASVSTVANLPAAANNLGIRTFVSDANATTFGTIVAGLGANFVPVYSDGTNWRIG
jgi:hypothetical protein